MHFVYIIVSTTEPRRHYVGLTNNVKNRLIYHNQGFVRSTASYRPWRLRSAICFSRRSKAVDFERYLKTGSGNAFLKKRLSDFGPHPVSKFSGCRLARVLCNSHPFGYEPSK